MKNGYTEVRSKCWKRLFTGLVLAAVAWPLPSHAQEIASLPEYKPHQQVSGVIRSWGSDQMGNLLKYWEVGFRKYQPNVFFSDTLKGTSTAQFGLHEWVADLAVSTRKIYPYEYYGIYRRSLMYPVEIAVATGSYDVPRKSFALAIFVNKKNPISRMTVQQLDRIYGAHRTGDGTIFPGIQVSREGRAATFVPGDNWV